MVVMTLEPICADINVFTQVFTDQLQKIDPDAVIRVDLEGPHSDAIRRDLSAARLRQMAPPSMNISLSPGQFRRG
jgi:hypothetical protein